MTAEEKAEAQEKAQAAATFTVPTEVAAAIEVEVAEMREVLAAATPAKLGQLLGEWMALVETQQGGGRRGARRSGGLRCAGSGRGPGHRSGRADLSRGGGDRAAGRGWR